MKQILIAAAIFFCFGLFAQAAPAADQQSDGGSGLDVAAAMKLLETKEQAFEKLANTNPKKGTPKYAAKDKKIKEIVEEIIDYRFISEYIIGKKWLETPESKKEELFTPFSITFKGIFRSVITCWTVVTP